MLYWLERYDEQKNITKTILTFKSYISNENSGGSDGGARPLPVRTHRHVAEPPLAGGRRKKMGEVRHPPTVRQHTLTRGGAPHLREADAKRWG